MRLQDLIHHMKSLNLLLKNLCKVYHDNFGVPVVVLRYFTVYGSRQRPDMSFHRFIKAILRGESIYIYGDGSICLMSSLSLMKVSFEAHREKCL